MYKLIKDEMTQKISCVGYQNHIKIIPFAPGNTDYQTFKKEINEETAELQDADGNTMTTEEANEFVATLP
jgi:hypothetical protein